MRISGWRRRVDVICILFKHPDPTAREPIHPVPDLRDHLAAEHLSEKILDLHFDSFKNLFQKHEV